MSNRYIVLDENGAYSNTVVWDGETDWSPPENHEVVREDSDEGQAALQALKEVPSQE